MRIVRRGTGSVVTWRGADGAAVSPGMDVRDREGGVHQRDRVRDVIRNFNATGSAPSIQVQERPAAEFTLPQRGDQEDREVEACRARLPFSTWSLPKLAEFLVAEGWSTTSATRPAHAAPRGRRHLSTLNLESLKDPDYAVRSAVEHLHAIATAR